MIATGDKRHGTVAGYSAGCRAQCCRDAIADWTRNARTRRYLEGDLTVDATGTIRRIRALMALGWRSDDIDVAIGRCGHYTANLLSRAHATVHRSTAQLYAAAYDRLGMQLGPSNTTRRRAAAAGWAPPLAWNDHEIDDPAAVPHGAAKDDLVVDQVVVQRLLDGQRIDSTPAEKAEAIRRWMANGGSRRAICQMHGWHESRYKQEAS